MRNLVTVENLSKQFSERQLFEEASLMINEGDRIGLIGINGSGKSTFLRILADEEAPDTGGVTIWGGVRVEFLQQEPVLDDERTVLEQIFYSDSPQMRLLLSYQQVSLALEKDPSNAQLLEQMTDIGTQMEVDGGWAAEANAKAILTKLGITRFDAKVSTLSGGQRKRVALARALIDRADLLILDEPTNHIDAETVAWLEDYLATTPGALLMVTHDRYFLDRVVNRIVEIDRRQFVSYVGNYEAYLEVRAIRHEQLAAAEYKRQKFLKRELEWLRRGAMARSTKQKARIQRAEALQQISYDRGDDKVSIALGGRRLGNDVVSATGLQKRYNTPNQDDLTVLDDVNFTLEPGDRIGIMGPNGAGKSTLLEILANRLEPDSGRVTWGGTAQLAYYDQQSIELHDDLRILEFIDQRAPVITTKDGERVDAPKMLEWFLFPRAMQQARIGSLSGGERRRLYLLRTLLHQPNVLFLDEPTNDLDIQTLGVLEEYLDHFKGCLIVVSHDRYFLDRTVDYLVYMENGKLGPRYPAPYSSFVRMRGEALAEIAAKEQASQTVSTSSASTRRSQPARKLSWKQQRELESVEQQIETFEAKKEHLLAEMNIHATDHIKLQALLQELETLEEALEVTMERWMELEELAGG